MKYKAKKEKANLVKDEIRQSVTFKGNVYQVAQRKAKKLGLSYPDYLRYLVVKDNEIELTGENIPYLNWQQELELAKAMDDVKNGRVSQIKDIEDYVNSL